MNAPEATRALKSLEAVTGGPLTFGELIWSIRECEEMTPEAFGKLLGISEEQLDEIEKDRRSVSAQRAATWAELLGYHPKQFIELAAQQRAGAER